MQQIDQREYGLITQQRQNDQIIQVGERIYQLTELPAQPLPVQPTDIRYQTHPTPTLYQPQPTAIHPTAVPQPGSQWPWQMIALLGVGLLIVTGFGTFLIVKAALPPAAAPVVVPPAPAPPPPAPVIIQQAPPPPPPTPYRRTNCKPAGIFGGEVCSTEEGFIR